MLATPDEQAEAFAREAASMRKYFTDPNQFVMENEALNGKITHIRARYDARLAELKPPLEDMLRNRAKEFQGPSLSVVLPRALLRITNHAQSTITAGLNFLASSVDIFSNHIQDKVAHFHHALILIGDVMDEHLRKFNARLEGISKRMQGAEGLLGVSAQYITAPRFTHMPIDTAVLHRLDELEARCMKLHSEVVTLKLASLRTGREHNLKQHSREPSPAGRSDESVHSHTSRYSRASSVMEAQQNLRMACQYGHTPDMIEAAQEVAFHRRAGSGCGVGLSGEALRW